MGICLDRLSLVECDFFFFFFFGVIEVDEYDLMEGAGCGHFSNLIILLYRVSENL